MKIHEILNITKPLCFLDLETTGVKVETARIVEICIIKINPDGSRETFNSLVNPIIKIPKEARAVHNITDDTVRDCPTFAEIAPKVISMISGCDLVGYNSNRFDFPLLFTECERAKVFFDYRSVDLVDVCNIFKRQESRELRAAYKFYLDKPLKNAHMAEADTEATIEILEAQLLKYSDLPRKISKLAYYSNYDREIIDFKSYFIRSPHDGQLYFNFGKNNGILAKDDPGYLSWILRSDMSQDVKNIAKELLDELEKEKSMRS